MSFSGAAAAAMTPGVPAQTLALSFRAMDAMLRAGMPLNHALESAADGAPWNLRNAWMNLAHHVSNGGQLHEGIAGYGNLFHPVVAAVVRTGEETGNLDHSFAMLAEFFEAEAELVRTLRSASIYPSIVVVTAIAAVSILAFLGFMTNAWAVRLMWFCAGVAVFWFALRFRWFQQAVRYVSMVLPFFGAVIQQLAVARFCLTFGLLTRAGLPYLEGLEATKPVVQHPVVNRAVTWIYSGVRNGNSLADCIRTQFSFPAIVRNLVAAGEASGDVDEALLKAGKFLREDAEYKIRNSAKFAGPVMILILAVIVGLIAAQFLQGYFNMIFEAVGE